MHENRGHDQIQFMHGFAAAATAAAAECKDQNAAKNLVGIGR